MAINPHPPTLSADLIELYRQLPPATIGHIINEGFVDTAIRPVFKRVSIVGTAVTLKLRRVWTASEETMRCRSSGRSTVVRIMAS